MSTGPQCEARKGCDSPAQCAREQACKFATCASRLERAYRLLRVLGRKAAMWDMLQLACHRLGVRCREIIRYIEERMNGR